MRALVLGAGNVGSAVAFDFSRDAAWDVTIVDVSAPGLAALRPLPRVTPRRADVSDAATLRQLAADHDVVIGALPSAIGYRTLAALIPAGRPIVDISFMPENALELDDDARAHRAVVVVDCGVAPGLSHMMVGHAAQHVTACDRVEILVGGLPVATAAPFEYKAGFSPYDVIEEYVRPVRIVRDGEVALREGLSELELVDIAGVGRLEAFLTDGLRTLAQTVRARDMHEKTLRYPGHARAMRALRDAGFFSKEPISVDAQPVRPLDVTAKLLFPHWRYEESEADMTVLRVAVHGRRGDEITEHTWELVDRYDPATRLRSMSRTTAFPAAIVARLAASGTFTAGVHPPEAIGRAGFLPHVLQQLADRGVHCVARELTDVSTPGRAGDA